MDSFLAGFADELTKTAFSKADAVKVLGLAKKKWLPKSSKRVTGDRLISVSPPEKDLADVARAAAKKGDTSFSKTLAEESLTRGRGVAAGKVKPLPFDRARDTSKRVTTPDEKKMREAVQKGHELDELAAAKRLPAQESARRFGHHNWDVILREHNRLSTLPVGLGRVRGEARTLRKNKEGAHLAASLGLDFGKPGTRVSRHARKRMSQILDRNVPESEFVERSMRGQGSGYMRKVDAAKRRAREQEARATERAKRKGTYQEPTKRQRKADRRSEVEAVAAGHRSRSIGNRAEQAQARSRAEDLVKRMTQPAAAKPKVPREGGKSPSALRRMVERLMPSRATG